MANAEISVKTYKIEPLKPKIERIGPAPKAAKGSCVLLHGWDSTGSDMAPIITALQKLPTASGWEFYAWTYDTHFSTFVEAAHTLFPQTDLLPRPIILLGYSEGGIVARQLVADGLQIKALVTICSPHLGTATWIPTPDFGSASVAPSSQDLKNLNSSSKDITHRKLYHFFAITCDDLLGHHDDDGVVLAYSALGDRWAVAERRIINLDYNNYIAGVDPHHEGMNPAYLGPVLDTCSSLF
jgi:pimeloyl-ACP methyl ester carboxylesterase